ncbi:MAG: hypothetical protein HY376_02915 [Candidatus Blackburnbacteria bacterium]|nr:hypothetical protein [Candidatus Blackburnbacteria bacterium]
MNNDFKALFHKGLKRTAFIIIGAGLGFVAVKLLPFKVVVVMLIMAGVLLWAKMLFPKRQQQQPP